MSWGARDAPFVSHVFSKQPTTGGKNDMNLVLAPCDPPFEKSWLRPCLKPRPQNRILLPLKGSIQNFPKNTLVLLIWKSPLPQEDQVQYVCYLSTVSKKYIKYLIPAYILFLGRWRGHLMARELHSRLKGSRFKPWSGSLNAILGKH